MVVSGLKVRWAKEQRFTLTWRVFRTLLLRTKFHPSRKTFPPPIPESNVISERQRFKGSLFEGAHTNGVQFYEIAERNGIRHVLKRSYHHSALGRKPKCR